jgi:hypothetical protein
MAAADPKANELKACALRHALDRLRMLGLVRGDSSAASAALARLIAEAFERGERAEENLILYALGRFQVQTAEHVTTEDDMNNIVELTAGNLAFGPGDIDAMSAALDAVCEALHIRENTTARELVALRIIEFARRGERSTASLKEHLLADAHGGSGC